MSGNILPTVEILGIPFSLLNTQETVEYWKQLIRSGEPHHVITANPEAVMMALKDPKLHRIFLQAAQITPDGIGAVWASRFYGTPLRERVTGADTTPLLLQAAEREGWSVFLLGASPESNALAVQHVQTRYPNLRVAGHHGYFGDQVKAVLEQIRTFAPEILLVGLGMPKQEYFIAEHLQDLKVPLAIGIGGVIDVWSGKVKRAPKWCQEWKVEWLYRLAKDPSRWRRQLALPQFALRVLADTRFGQKWKD
jgi:N-acetylglucosaminyldiphosphoundecaprenol N-acetyl-beta-D-mannosaminyltransferase